MEMATSLLEINQKSGGPVTIAESLTGGDEIKRETCTMEAITNYTREYDVVTEIVIPQIQYIIGTTAMTCEVSSNHIGIANLLVFLPVFMFSCKL